jgi:hypothetical protein
VLFEVEEGRPTMTALPIIGTIVKDVLAYFKLSPVKVLGYAIAAKLVLDKASDLVGGLIGILTGAQ